MNINLFGSTGIIGTKSLLLLNKYSSPMILATFVWVVIHFSMLSGTGFSKYMFDTHLLIIITLYFILSHINYRRIY